MTMTDAGTPTKARGFDPAGKFDEAWNTQFKTLLADVPKNISLIDQALLALVHFLSAGVILCDDTYREDVNGEVHIFLMEKIRAGEYNSRLAKGNASAFWFFTQMANRRFWQIAESLATERSKRVTMLDMTTIFRSPSRPDPPVDTIRRMKHPRSFALIDKRDRATAAACIDNNIKRALDAMRLEHDNERLITAIDALQQLRLAFLGEFRAIRSPAIRYTKSRRLERTGDDFFFEEDDDA